MGIGKVASQAGHAYIGAFLLAPKHIQEEYQATGIGTKVCLSCPDLDHLIRYGWGGVPTPTALGVGPINREQARFLRKLQIHK
jgi:hypothetical protein